MAKPDASDDRQVVEHVAEEAMTSEKREDFWAIIIAAGILLFSVAFPTQIHTFFNRILYLF